MSEESPHAAGVSNPVGSMTESPLAFALILVGLYWTVKVLRPVTSSRPPRAPYWIPWLGSAIEMGKDPDGFFNNMTKLLGPVFRVKTLGREMVFITSPSLISAVYRDSQNYDFLTIRTEMGQTVFNISSSINEKPYMLDTYMPDLHRALLPKNLEPMVSQYLTSVHDTLLSMVSSMDGASGPLKTFIIPPAYRAAAHAGFGPGFPAEASYPSFKAFDDNFALLSAGIPRFLFSKALKAWDEVVDIMETYVTKHDQLGEEMSSFVQVALNGHRRSDWTYRDVATVLASQLWALQANVIFVAYWLIAILLQQPEGLSPLVEELDLVRREWQALNPSTALGPAYFHEITSNSKTLPLLSSAIQEVLRFTSSTFSIRRVMAPVKLGGYDLRAGDRVVCATRHIHLDDEIHPHAGEFDMRRYLETPRAIKDGTVVANHTLPFGGGVSMCEGRHFAMTELRLFIAMLLTYATIDVDEGSEARPDFAWERIGLGIMHPRGDMDVILRKREL